MQSEAITCTRASFVASSQSEAIRGKQMQSEAIRGNHLYSREFRRLVAKALRLLVALSVRKLEEDDDSRCGKVARGQVVRPRCMQRRLDIRLEHAIRGNQSQSEAITCMQRGLVHVELDAHLA